MMSTRNRPKISILHIEPRKAHDFLRQRLGVLDACVDLQDLRYTSLEILSSRTLILNRVYPPIASRSGSIDKTVALLRELERRGIRCLNGHRAARADYSKAFAARRLVEAGIRTPATLAIEDASDDREALAFARRHGYPLVWKPDCGGGGAQITALTSEKELLRALEGRANGDGSTERRPKMVLQELILPARRYDCKISVIDHAVVGARRRGLVAEKIDTPWIGSHGRGSRIRDFSPAGAEVEMALAATDAIQATINEVDVGFCAEGPFVIENNPTPGEIGLARIADQLVAKLRRMI